jgi:hypothetical protein
MVFEVFWEGGRSSVLSLFGSTAYLLGKIRRIWEVRICRGYIDERLSIEAHWTITNLSIAHACYLFLPMLSSPRLIDVSVG